jgi:hypothetical protein
MGPPRDHRGIVILWLVALWGDHAQTPDRESRFLPSGRGSSMTLSRSAEVARASNPAPFGPLWGQVSALTGVGVDAYGLLAVARDDARYERAPLRMKPHARPCDTQLIDIDRHGRFSAHRLI